MSDVHIRKQGPESPYCDQCGMEWPCEAVVYRELAREALAVLVEILDDANRGGDGVAAQALTPMALLTIFERIGSRAYEFTMRPDARRLLASADVPSDVRTVHTDVHRREDHIEY